MHNAYNEGMLREIEGGLDRLARDPGVRALVILSNGKHFQAEPTSFLRTVADLPPEARLELSRLTCNVMRKLNGFPALTMTLVHGACYGGGCGFVACSDVAVASDDAVFALTEVRVGQVPSPIAHYLNSAMGERKGSRPSWRSGDRPGSRDRPPGIRSATSSLPIRRVWEYSPGSAPPCPPTPRRRYAVPAPGAGVLEEA